MLLRSLVSIVSLVAILAAIVVQLLEPALQLYIFYVILAWVVAGFFVYRLPAMSRPVRLGTGSPSRPSASAAALADGHPLDGSSSAPPGTSAGALGFCMYCGSLVEPGTALCPNCGRSLPLA